MKGGRRRSTTDADVARWTTLYRAGLSTREIAAREGVGFGCVQEHLHRAGVQLRPSGRRRRFDVRAVKDAARRLGVRGAAREFGCSVWTVYALRRAVTGATG